MSAFIRTFVKTTWSIFVAVLWWALDKWKGDEVFRFVFKPLIPPTIPENIVRLAIVCIPILLILSAGVLIAVIQRQKVKIMSEEDDKFKDKSVAVESTRSQFITFNENKILGFDVGVQSTDSSFDEFNGNSIVGRNESPKQKEKPGRKFFSGWRPSK